MEIGFFSRKLLILSYIVCLTGYQAVKRVKNGFQYDMDKSILMLSDVRQKNLGYVLA